jgi:hypothetical protein
VPGSFKSRTAQLFVRTAAGGVAISETMAMEPFARPTREGALSQSAERAGTPGQACAPRSSRTRRGRFAGAANSLSTVATPSESGKDANASGDPMSDSLLTLTPLQTPHSPQAPFRLPEAPGRPAGQQWPEQQPEQQRSAQLAEVSGLGRSRGRAGEPGSHRAA